jgi:hypothetical protein
MTTKHPYRFECRCGHRWQGDAGDDYTCPHCGAGDGDHQLTRMEPVGKPRTYLDGYPVRPPTRYEKPRGNAT